MLVSTVRFIQASVGPNSFLIVSGDMRLQPNVGSDRSWVWKVAADYSEQPPTAETLAIRFANPESVYYELHMIPCK